MFLFTSFDTLMHSLEELVAAIIIKNVFGFGCPQIGAMHVLLPPTCV